MAEMNSIQLVVYSLVSKFVQRQNLVLDVMSDIRPDLIATTAEERSRPSKEYMRATQSGYWGKDKEWMYFFHGKGCRLIHMVTQERIEWDAPCLQRFDPDWFLNWVDWLLSQEDEIEIIPIIKLQLADRDDELRTLIRDVLDQLHKKGMLRYYPDCTNMYELV